MKKLIMVIAASPALTFAHESLAHGEFQHALEHNLNNPLFAIALFIGLAGIVAIVRKAFK